MCTGIVERHWQIFAEADYLDKLEIKGFDNII